MQKYPENIENQMQRYYRSLSEKDKRRYAAVEAVKLGRGGKSYICKLFGCDYKTIAKGQQEIQDEAILEETKIRKKGGGQKQATEKLKGLEKAFFRVLAKYTAGSPQDETIKWTNLTNKEITEKLAQEGFEVSKTVVAKLLRENNFRRRKAVKSKAAKQSEKRDDQFKKIAWLKESYMKKNSPVVSMDTKKKNR
jgi:hypothetical protein